MDTADKHKRMWWTGAVKGHEVFESNDTLLLNEQKLIKGKDYVEIAVSRIQNVPLKIQNVPLKVQNVPLKL